jgi:hypothetical protein
MGEMYTQEQMAAALERTNGMVSLAAKVVGCHRATFYHALERHPELKAICRETREEGLDIAETALRKKVLEGNLGAICFMLKCLGKHRGYVEKQQIEVTEGGQTHVIETIVTTREAIEQD